jgi:secondary thiamine-phosphate synthase enzyme
MMDLDITTSDKKQVLDITDEVEKHLPAGTGLVNIFIQHTTAAITTADLDPGTDLDLLDALSDLLPKKQWRHPHNPAHAPDHLVSSIIGPGVSVPFKTKKLRLGMWQRIILVELDGPRQRKVTLNFL